MSELGKRAADFIRDHDPFGDHFSQHDLLILAGEPTRRLAECVPMEEEACEYCCPGIYTGLPGGACENCMNTGLKYPERSRTVVGKSGRSAAE